MTTPLPEGLAEVEVCAICGGVNGHRDVSPLPHEECSVKGLVRCPQDRAALSHFPAPLPETEEKNDAE